jgi:hypothetical protein
MIKRQSPLAGVYRSSRPTWEERPFEVTFEIAKSSSSILVEGGVRRRHAEPPFAFEIEVPFNSISVVSSTVQVRSSQIGELQGQLLSCREGLELIASSDEDVICSLHLQFFERDAFEVSGMLSLRDQAVSFAARETGYWQKLPSAKVLPIRGRS